MLVGMVSEAVGVLVAVVVQGQLVSKTRKTGDCGDDDKMSEKQLEDEVVITRNTIKTNVTWNFKINEMHISFKNSNISPFFLGHLVIDNDPISLSKYAPIKASNPSIIRHKIEEATRALVHLP